jgi:hypothetical protein
VDVDVGFDECLGFRHCQRFFFGVRVRICIGRIIINLRKHYDNLDGKSYKLGGGTTIVQCGGSFTGMDSCHCV